MNDSFNKQRLFQQTEAETKQSGKQAALGRRHMNQAKQNGLQPHLWEAANLLPRQNGAPAETQLMRYTHSGLADQADLLPEILK